MTTTNEGAETVKGSHVAQAMRWVDERLGPNTFKEKATAIDGVRWGLILPGSWYSVDVLLAVLRRTCTQVDVSVEDATTEIARLNAESDLTSMYRFFMRIAQPQRVLSFTPKLWRTYVSFGDSSALTNDKGHYVGQGEGFREDHVDWVCGCWRGFIPAAIELAGGTVERSTILKRWRMPNGRYAVQFEASYREGRTRRVAAVP